MVHRCKPAHKKLQKLTLHFFPAQCSIGTDFYCYVTCCIVSIAQYCPFKTGFDRGLLGLKSGMLCGDVNV